MTVNSGGKIWPILDIVVVGFITGAFFGISAADYSPPAGPTNLLLISWPFLVIAYILGRTHAFSKHDEDVEEAFEGYVVPSFAFYAIALSGPVLLALYSIGQLVPSLERPALAASAFVYVALIGALVFGIEYLPKQVDGAAKEPITSRLFIPLIFVSTILWFGTEDYFDYANWIVPKSITMMNEYIRILIIFIIFIVLIVLVVTDTIRKIKAEGIGFGERWRELRERTQAQPRSRGIIKSFLRAIRKFAKFSANIFVIVCFSIKQTVVKFAETIALIMRFLNFSRLKLLVGLTLIALVGIAIVDWGPQAGLAAFRSPHTNAYDSALFIVGLFVIGWCGGIAVLHSHVRSSRHFEVPESFASVVLFSTLGVFTASAIFHVLAATRVLDLPGFGWTDGPFFVIYGTVWLMFLLSEIRWIWLRILLIGACALVLLLWALRSWPSLLQSISLPDPPAAAAPAQTVSPPEQPANAMPANDSSTEMPSQSPSSSVVVEVQEPAAAWLFGRWGLYGSCREPLVISGNSDELTIELDRQVERVPIQSATSAEVVAGSYRFQSSSGAITATFGGQDFGRIISCPR